MSEKKQYTLSIGVTAFQSELTIKRDYRVMKLVKALKLDKMIKGAKEIQSFSIEDWIDILLDSELIEKFLSEILYDESGMSFGHHDKGFEIQKFGELRNSELEEIINDFFTMNPTLKRLFKSSSFKMGTNMMSSLFAPTESGVMTDSLQTSSPEMTEKTEATQNTGGSSGT